ncbi:condensation domain-containing protein, partial [Mucilaginibacter sp. RCC_168]|uniref:condensation domain-containing protein n=1 Tax=Mucilaginibacter sp. RCC_168 TaxID=3239221 RepID=UPI0035232AEE
GTDLEEQLAEIWKEVLNRDRVGVTDDFFELGGDSIKAIQISTRLYKLGYKLEIKDLFLHPTVYSLSRVMKKAVVEAVSDQSAVKGTVLLTPIQQLFFAAGHAEPQHYNQSVLLSSAERYQIKGIRLVMKKLQEHHDALRMSYHIESGSVRQMNNGLSYPVHVGEYDLRESADVLQEMENLANELQQHMSLETGPVMRTGIFRLPDGDRLLIVIHHLVVDGISWRILFEDIGTLYRQYQDGEELELPSKTDSFRLWSERLHEYAEGERFLKERSYWEAQERIPVERLREDHPVSSNRTGDAGVVSLVLEESATAHLLSRVNQAYGTEINDILLTGLGLAVAQSFGNKSLLIGMEGHGREGVLPGIDVNRTVGWFTSVYPVILDMSYKEDLSRQIREVKETLQRIPNKGIGYGILKYLTSPEKRGGLQFSLTPEISFNYLGEFDADLQEAKLELSSDSQGSALSAGAERGYNIDITGMISSKRLILSVSYNRHQYEEATINGFRDNYRDSILRIITHCVSRKETELTPSDLTYKHLSIQDLER